MEEALAKAYSSLFYLVVSKNFFFEKKKQKTFATFELRQHPCHTPQDQKFFGYFFSKK